MVISKTTIFSLNIGMSASLAGLVTLINSEAVGVIFLQEVRMTSTQIESQLPGFQAVSNIDIDNLARPGVAIAWRNSVPVVNVHSLTTCRLQVASLEQTLLINVYAPSGSEKKRERNIFFGHDLFDALNFGSFQSLVVGGDFNCLLEPIDVEEGIGFNNKKCVILKDLIKVAKGRIHFLQTGMLSFQT